MWSDRQSYGYEEIFRSMASQLAMRWCDKVGVDADVYG